MKEKKNKSIKWLLEHLLLVMLVVLISPGIKTEAASKISLNKTSVSVYKGKNCSLQLKNVKKGTKVTWKTSKSGVASIKANGTSCKVTGKKAGTAVISAKIGKNTYKCKVTVKNLPVALSAKTKSLKAGKSFTLSLNNTSSTAKWSVSNKKILKLKKLGKNKYQVSGLKAGTAKVYAKIGSKKYTCTVTVKAVTSAANKVPGCAAKQTVYAKGISGGPWTSGRMEVLALPSQYIFIKNLDAKAKITDIKSSNPNIKAQKREGINAIELQQSNLQEMTDLSGMSSKISFKVTQNGKTYSLSCLINVKPAESPVSSFKIGSRNIAKYFAAYMYVEGLDFKGKQKVSVQMASGYVLDGLNILIKENGSYKSQEIKNGSVVDFDKCMDVSVSYHTTKKPANYTAPTLWNAVVKSPLHDYVSLILNH